MRIAIVNDAVIATETVRRVVLRGGQDEIAWTATNEAQAVDLCCLDGPDLILLDLMTSGTEGVETTRHIMTCCPCPILVVTTSLNDNCSRVREAMGAGALDAVNTPALEWPGTCRGAGDLLAKIEAIRKLLGAESSTRSWAGGASAPQVGDRTDDPLIAIGASAGGPAALAAILGCLPTNFRSPVVIVQHVDSQFAPALAGWLDNQTPLRVRLAEEGDCPTPGNILLAGRDLHLVFDGCRHLAYQSHPAVCSYRPSVDVFLDSIQHHWPGEVVGVLLTGMGRDGAQGLLRLRQSGHHTIAQDQATSAVYGMPKAAAELGAAEEILRLDQIGLRLRALGAQGVRIHA